MSRQLDRLFAPKSIAVVGGGAWCAHVIQQSKRMGFSGDIWPVHPEKAEVEGCKAYACLDDLPAAPDAAFVGVNRHLTIDIVRALAQRGAGGAVCFASGFSEAAAEDDASADLQADLIAAAGDMPFLGPNCYGFINALDGALLWPDQHGAGRVENGVAILTQSSNIAINLTMQQRGLPLSHMVTCGNMAQTSQAQIAHALLDDPRVTAIGLHIEGFGKLREWEAFAKAAYAKSVPVIALKVGASDQAQQATISHTASLAGSDAGAQAFLNRLGIPRLKTLPAFLETLKLLHAQGRLASGKIASISCSGGEASLIADMAIDRDLEFPALSKAQKTQLRAALGPMVALNNPLDYHTYVWRDEKAMTKAWSGMTGEDIAMTLSIVDYPKTDPSDWAYATKAALNVRAETGAPFGVVATLPELLPLDVSLELMAGGVVPFHGLDEALAAIEAAHHIKAPADAPICLPGKGAASEVLGESEAKAALASYGLATPRSRLATTADEIAKAVADLRAPFAIKGVGLAHKSEHGAVRLGVWPKDAAFVAAEIDTDRVLIEEMTGGAVAELLIGVLRDPAHGYVLTLGAGGVLTELLRDTTSLLLPASRDEIWTALNQLKCAPLLTGFRGEPGTNKDALLDAIDAVQAYVLDHTESVDEVEINPLICTPDRVVAVDALIRRG